MGVTSLASARIHREPEYEPVGAAGPSTPEMALHRLPGAEDEKYVSVVGRDELASFQRNGHNGDEFGDEDIDFTPQNGYVEPDNMELKEGYLNSAFHKSLHQPLTQEKSPTALGNINSVSDIPIPKVFASKPAEDGEEPAEAKPMPRNMDEWGQAAYNTLPKSFREQNIVTA